MFFQLLREKMGLYDTFRFNGGPTLYGPNKTAVTADVLEIGFIFAALILFVSLIIVLPSVRGKEVLVIQSRTLAMPTASHYLYFHWEYS